MSLNQLLQSYEPHFLSSLSSNDNSQLQQSLFHWSQIEQAFHQEKKSGTLAKETENLVGRLSRRIELVAYSLLKVDQEIQKRFDTSHDALDSLFNLQGSSAFSSTASARNTSSSPRKKEDESHYPDSLPSKALRAWILENLADPFPSRQDKEKLVNKTNLEEQGKATLAYNQVVLWFTNARRRCRWTVFFRRFADSNKERLLELLGILAADESKEQLSAISQKLMEWKIKGASNLVQAQGLAEECKEAYQTMIDWINDKHTKRMGEWMERVEKVAAEVKQQEKERRKNRARAVKEYGGMGDRRAPSSRTSSSDRHHSNGTSSSRSISGNSVSSLWSDSNRTYSTSSTCSNLEALEREDSLSPPPPLRSEDNSPGLLIPVVPSQPLPRPPPRSPSSFIYRSRDRFSNISNVRGDASSSESEDSATPVFNPSSQRLQPQRSNTTSYPPDFSNFLPIPAPNFSNQHLNLGMSNLNHAPSPGSDGGYSLGALNSLQNSPDDGNHSGASTPAPSVNQLGRSNSQSKGKKRQIDEIEIEVDANELERDGKKFKGDGASDGFDFDFQTDFSVLNGNHESRVGGGGSGSNGFLPSNWVSWDGQI